jgi:hypothetical protein
MKNRACFYLLLVLGSIFILTNSCKKDEDNENQKDLIVGQNYQGGIIAYVLVSGDPGYNLKVQHGLIVSPSDQGTSVVWYNGSFISTGATGQDIGTGNENTNKIVASQGAGNYAAKICYDLVSGGYSDWYLPSVGELQKLYLNKSAIGMPDEEWWSSTEFSEAGANSIYFGNGSTLPTTKDFNTRVRAVRSF